MEDDHSTHPQPRPPSADEQQQQLQPEEDQAAAAASEVGGRQRHRWRTDTIQTGPDQVTWEAVKVSQDSDGEIVVYDDVLFGSLLSDAEMELHRFPFPRSRNWNGRIFNLPSDDFRPPAIGLRLWRMIMEGEVKGFEDETRGITLTEIRGPQDNTVLHMAAIADRVELITWILLKFEDLIKIKNSKGDLPLHVAARAGGLDSVKYLAQWIEENQDKGYGGGRRNGSTNESRGEHGTSRDCVHPNHLQGQQQQGDDQLTGGTKITIDMIGEANVDSQTALHIALENHDKEMAVYLVEKYPIASYYADFSRMCPLYLAIKAGYWELVELMLARKPIGDEDVQDRLVQGKSVVHAVIMAKNTDLLKRMLSSQPALIEVYDEEGRTPLSYAAFIGNLDAVRYFLDEFLDHVYNIDKDGSFPIHEAARGGHVGVMEEFLSRLPSTIMNLVNRDDQSILHLASRAGKADMVSYLLRIQGVEKSINSRDKDGNTPLHLAVAGGHAKVVSILTWDERVKLSLKNNIGMTALDAAEYYEGSPPKYEQRLVWLALRYANAPRRAQGEYSFVTSEEKLSLDEVRKNVTGRSTIARQLNKQGNPIIEPPNLDNYKDRVNTLLLVSTLVATVTFAAGFTIPGGYSSSGTSIFADRRAFQTFVIINTIALYSSILADVILIWAQLGDLRLIVISLRIAVPLLGLSLAMMSVSFMVGVGLLVNDVRWLYITVLVMGSIFIATVLIFFIPLYSPCKRRCTYIAYLHLRMMLLLIRDHENA